MPKKNHPERQVHEAIGARVRQARALRGWSQERLAEEAGIQPESISRYERGLVPLSISLLMRLGEALGVKIDALLGVSRRGDAVVLIAAEIELIEKWRLLDKEGQGVVLGLVRWGGRGKTATVPIAPAAKPRR